MLELERGSLLAVVAEVEALRAAVKDFEGRLIERDTEINSLQLEFKATTTELDECRVEVFAQLNRNISEIQRAREEGAARFVQQELDLRRLSDGQMNRLLMVEEENGVLRRLVMSLLSHFGALRGRPGGASERLDDFSAAEIEEAVSRILELSASAQSEAAPRLTTRVLNRLAREWGAIWSIACGVWH